MAILLMAVLSMGAVAPVAATETSDDSSTTAESHETEGTSGTSGDPSEPQPESTADENEGGANGDCPEGPYCSTRDGSASENGKGEGEAKGKPCAGCVGKADNKNPKGQMPDGSDRNAGYECDRNQGVGQGNPAHTGCTEEELGEESGDEAGDEAGEPAAGDEGGPDEPGDTTTDEEVAGEEAAGEEAAGQGGAEVLGVEASANGAGNAAVADAEETAMSGVLPATGSPALLGAGLVAGLGLLGGGTALLLRRRRTA